VFPDHVSNKSDINSKLPGPSAHFHMTAQNFQWKWETLYGNELKNPWFKNNFKDLIF
jgi:hypothetical protein